MESKFDMRSTPLSPTIFIKMQGKLIRIALLMLLGVLCVARSQPVSAAAPSDPVLEWNAVMNDTVLAAASSPWVTARAVAMVSGSVFDAVNGIKPRYKALHVRPGAPRHASQSAAAIQSAYAMLINLYPAQIASLTARRDASIAALSSTETAKSIQAGIAWVKASPTAFGHGA